MSLVAVGGLSDFDARVLALMVWIGDKVYRSADAKAKTQRIRSAMSLGNAYKSGGIYGIDITVDTVKAPEFMAYEFGSGLHRTKGTPGTYRIPDKESKSILAFHWDSHTPDYPTGKKYLGEGRGGKLLFAYVDHPGVKAEPIFEPAFNEVKAVVGETIRERIGLALVSSFRVEMS